MILFLFFVLSIFFSFLCSILEAVLLSITPAYVQREVSEKSTTGTLLQSYKEDIDRPLSAILTLNTIAHTVGAIGVGAEAGRVFGSNHFNLGPFNLSYEAIIATLMTLAILILSEIIPKTIGANNWRSLAPFTVKTLRILIWILAPFVWISQLITKSLKKDGKSVLSRADFAALARTTASSGELNESESKVINNLLSFERQSVRNIMTPKTVVFMGQQDETLEQFVKENRPIRFSRIPIYGENRDDITGVVLKVDLLSALNEGLGNKPLKDFAQPVKTVEDNLPLPELFTNFTSERVHLSVVMDEYGAVVGLVSMEDMFETLLGVEIVDEYDNVADLQGLAKKQYEERKRDQKENGE